MTFTPRFGEITNYDEVITDKVYNNIKRIINMTDTKWFIYYSRKNIELDTNSYINGIKLIPRNGYSITLIDNYFNQCYFIIPEYYNATRDNIDILQMLNDNTIKTDIPPEFYRKDNPERHTNPTILIRRALGYTDTHDVALSDEEITCLQNNINITTIRHNPMLLQIKCMCYENKFIKLEEKINNLEDTNKSQSIVINRLNNTIQNLERLQKEDSTFMTYLKNLFVWN